MGVFFLVMKGMRIYYSKFNDLPLVGNLPDMTSENHFYVKLKKIYERKAVEDKKVLVEIIEKELAGLSLKDERRAIIQTWFKSKEYSVLDIVCKNWPQISLFEYSTLENSLPNASELDIYEEQNKVNFIWYLMIKASQRFQDKFGHFPGHENHLGDLDNFKAIFIDFIKNSPNSSLLPLDIEEFCPPDDRYISEFLRMSDSKVITAISIIGSIASQEIIKLLTYCFMTVNNTIIYDGVNVTVSTFNL